MKPLRDLDFKIWEHELGDDFDRDFILNGLKYGFDIISDKELPENVSSKNHPSAHPSSPLYKKAHDQILIELENGNYDFAKILPKIISPLGILNKPDGGVRIIHDCSLPDGSAVNDFAGDPPRQKFQTVDDAAKLVTPNCFMAKVDLKSAYRSVRISKRSQQVTGFKWIFPDGKEYVLYDKKLPFGAKLAPNIFHRLSQAIKRMMSRKGFTIIAYLDDFFLCEPSQSKCMHALNTLINLLCKLGFLISWSKVVGPCQQMTFLGVEIDSTKMELRLPDAKLSELKRELANFRQCKRATKKQLQSLVGKLNWASAVVHGGRVFLRRIINAIMRLKQDWHKLRIGGDMLSDILWWQEFMAEFNGKSIILENSPITSVATDACKTGGGALFENDWHYSNWEIDHPATKGFHINELEAFAVVLAARKWATAWRNHRVILLCDNATTVACINKCTSRNHIMMSYLRELFWLSASNNFHLKAVHVPGHQNVYADHISRLHDPKSFEYFMRHCLPQPLYISHLNPHMSSNALSFLLCRHAHWPGPEGIG